MTRAQRCRGAKVSSVLFQSRGREIMVGVGFAMRDTGIARPGVIVTHSGGGGEARDVDARENTNPPAVS